MLLTFIMFGVITTGLVYLVNPAVGREIAKRLAKVAVVIIATDQIISCLWGNGTGKVMLLVAVALALASLARRRKE